MRIHNNGIEYTRTIVQDSQILDIAALRADHASAPELRIHLYTQDAGTSQSITLTDEQARALRDHLNDANTWNALSGAA